MINYMINFANNFDADCRDGFVSNDEAYTEKAIDGVDLDKKLKKWCEKEGLKFVGVDYVDLLVKFARIPQEVNEWTGGRVASLFLYTYYTRRLINRG